MASVFGLVEGLANTALYTAKARYADVNDTKPALDVDFDVHELVRKLEDPGFKPEDFAAYADMALHSNAVDDRKMLLEKALVLLSRQADAPWSKPLQQQVINLLYYDLPHPPASFLSMKTTPAPTTSEPSPRGYAYRTADGSGYNLLSPNLGRARTPYARSVPGTNFTPLKSLPDPGLLFDTLLRRPDVDEDGENQKFTPHPGGLSSMFFAFANLIIHSIFNTDHVDPGMNSASSYLDLSPLYGSSEQELNGVRNKNGRGRLHEDVFADQRLLAMPPSTCALLIMFSRNHNYIADQLYAINENSKYVDPETLRGKDDAKSKEKLEAQEEDLFQRARMINCVQFMRVILGDYVGAILGLARDGYSWRLDPLSEMRHLDHSVSPRGEGNVCSIEFNLLYRWHATLSSEDTKWTEGVFKGIMGSDVDFNKATPDQFRTRVGAAFASRNPDPTTWTFEGLTRDPSTQKFPDAKLAEILHNATDWPAGAFGSKGIPAVMRVIEIMAIEGARKWGTCSLNEFRKFMGLKPHKTFAEWNPDESVSKTAAALYKDIDNLELYVGLLAEATKKPQPGAALCPGYTISRAILADAVCLTRGDRFFTVELTPHNLTAWGYNDCQVDPDDGSYGGMISKVLFRNLPDYYPKNSAYAYFPLLVPSTLEKELAKRGDAVRYDWARPPAKGVGSTSGGKVVLVPTSEEVLKMVLNVVPTHHYKENFIPESKGKLKVVTGAAGGPDSNGLITKLLSSRKKEWADWFLKRTLALIDERSIKSLVVGGGAKKQEKFYLDVVKDVLSVVGVQFVSEQIAGLPLMTSTNKGSISETEMKDKLGELCRFIFLQDDTVSNIRLRDGCRNIFDELKEFIVPHLNSISGKHTVNSTSSAIRDKVTRVNCTSHTFLKLVLDEITDDVDVDTVATWVFEQILPTVPLFAKALSLVVDYYLDESRVKDRTTLVDAARLKTTGGDETVKKLVDLALKASPLIPRVQARSSNGVRIGGKEVNRNDTVVVAFPGDDISHVDLSQYGLMSPDLFAKLCPKILGPILALPALDRAPSTSGHFTAFLQPERKKDFGAETLYLSSEGAVTPFPESLVVQFVR